MTTPTALDYARSIQEDIYTQACDARGFSDVTVPTTLRLYAIEYSDPATPPGKHMQPIAMRLSAEAEAWIVGATLTQTAKADKTLTVQNIQTIRRILFSVLRLMHVEMEQEAIAGCAERVRQLKERAHE